MSLLSKAKSTSMLALKLELEFFTNVWVFLVRQEVIPKLLYKYLIIALFLMNLFNLLGLIIYYSLGNFNKEPKGDERSTMGSSCRYTC